MADEAGSVSVEVRAEMAEFHRRLGEAEREVRKFDTNARRNLSGTERAFVSLGKAGRRLRGDIFSIQGALVGLGAGLSLRKIIGDFAEFEQGLIQVGKTTGLEGANLQALGDDIQDIGREVPVATARLLELASAAGQLGVSSREDIATFTEVLGKMELATDVAGEEGARSLARLLTITGESLSEVDRLGSSIVDLGNNMATTEQEIVQTSTFLASATSAYGLTAEQVVGLSAALRALGQRAETSGSAVGAALSEISTALAEGGEGLQTLVDLTGQSADQLRRTFQEDATQVLVEFAEALGNLPAAQQTQVLEEFNLAGRETRRVIGAMAQRVDVLRGALERSERGWKKNTALSEEAFVAAQSFTAQMQLAANDVNEAAVAIGRELAPEILEATKQFREFIQTAADTGQITETAEDLAGAFKFVAENVDLIVTSIAALYGARLGSAFGVYGAAIGAAAGALSTYLALLEDGTDISDTHRRAVEDLRDALEDAEDNTDRQTKAIFRKADADLKAAEAALTHAKAMVEFRRSSLPPGVQPGSDAAEQYIGNAEKMALQRLGEFQRIQRQVDEARANLRTTPKGDRLQSPEEETGEDGGGGGGLGGSDDTTARANAYENLSQRIRESTSSLQAETDALRGLNPLVDDYGFALEKARAQQELLNAAERAGLEITPDLRREIENIATGYANAAAAQAEVIERNDELREAMEFQKDALKGVFSDLRSALEDGKITWEEFGDIAISVLDKIVDKITTDLVDAIFEANNAGGGGGGFFDFLGGLLGGGLGGGGSIDPWNDWTLPGFARGTGNTGGRRGEPRGVVHGQEAVIPLPSGGKVPVQMQGGGRTKVEVDVGVSVDNDGNLQAYVRNVSQREAGSAVREGIRGYDRARDKRYQAGAQFG